MSAPITGWSPRPSRPRDGSPRLVRGVPPRWQRAGREGGSTMILTADNRGEFARHIFAGTPDEDLLVALAEYEAYVPTCGNDDMVEVLADTADLIRREMDRRESDPHHLITCAADGCSHRFFRVVARGHRARFCFDCADERFGPLCPRCGSERGSRYHEACCSRDVR